MNYIELENQIALLDEAKNFNEARELIFNNFCMDKIIVHTTQQIKNSNEIGNNIYEVNIITDSKFNSTDQLILLGHKMIPLYDKFLNRMYCKGGDQYNMQILAEYTLTNFATEKNSHDISNRFSFSRKNPFGVMIDGSFHSIAYESLNFTEEIQNELQEYFKIRCEIFEELRMRTSSYISKINSEFWRITPIKTDVKTRNILMSFFIAVEHTSSLLKFDKKQIDLLYTVYRNILGFTPSEFNRLARNKKKKDLWWEFREIIENQYS